ncbi:ANTAR domain-containing protein [Actinophytocola sp.]|uniref:ANTAR domain-containing protein n=1 Tax=Actinophytocola sp. TaxID=1872138 RepID=UPI003D6A3813
MTSTALEELAETFVELADAVVDKVELDDFLNLLADRCVRLLDVSAAGLSLASVGGEPYAVGASGERARVLALLTDGPGPASHRTGAPVVVPDLTTPHWPEFTTAATTAGFASAHALPMRVRTEVIGALTLLRTVPGVLDEVTERIAQALVDVATIGLMQVRALRRQEDLTAQLQHALNSRVVIEQAKGVTGERLGLGMNAAFDALRHYARSNNLRIADLATSVVDGTFDTGRLVPPS